jgi:NAD(P)-dependent dehydrogenase (short-subunit alcohol dehydrogenase family)
VLVTGASSGIGPATALRLAAEGMNVPAPRYAVGKDARALSAMPSCFRTGFSIASD